MATPRQIESARINGARSRGPKTPEGKRRSALNALKHGLTSRTIPLDPESAAVLDQMIVDYTADIRPTTPEETLLARRLAISAFRVRQAWAAETAVWNRALAEYESFPARDRLALAAIAISSQLMQIMRHECCFDRQYHVAFTRLLTLRKATREKLILQNEPDFPPPQPVFLQNEPDATNHEPPTASPPPPTAYHPQPAQCAPLSHPPSPISLIPLPPPVVPCLPGHLL